MGNISDKLQYLAETKEAIKEALVYKGVEVAETDTFRSYADKIFSIEGGGSGGSGGSEEEPQTRPAWTGHADVEGLRAIGWTYEDIAYYQENGVNWNEKDDEYHKVTDDNKALYGVLTADNISSYKHRIVYLPKIDTSEKTSMNEMFSGCYSLVSIPQLDTAKVTGMYYTFSSCNSLVCIPPLDTSKVTNMNSVFFGCNSLVCIPPLNTAKVTDMQSMFNSCYSLRSIPQLDTANVTRMRAMFRNCYSLFSIPQLDTTKVTDMYHMFYSCASLVSIPQLNTANVTNMDSMFYSCASLVSIPQLNTAKVTNMQSMFNNCSSLVSIPQLDTAKVTGSFSNTFGFCYSLTYINIKNIRYTSSTSTIPFSYSSLLSKESLLYLINNEASTLPITIKLGSTVLIRLANDADIVAALANHPNITLA